MENILNFRKLAANVKNEQGQEIKNIYRSANPSVASSGDIEELLKLNINDVIDLRSLTELSDDGIIDNSLITVKHINIIDDAKQNDIYSLGFSEAGKFMIELYENVFVETEGFKNEFDYIKSLNGKPFLFHCTAGKDRTGITGALLMHILGFNQEQIVSEYLILDQLLIDSLMSELEAKIKQFNISVDIEQLKNIVGVDKLFILSFYQGVADKYGSLDNFIAKKLKITSDEITKFKQDYLI